MKPDRVGAAFDAIEERQRHYMEEARRARADGDEIRAAMYVWKAAGLMEAAYEFRRVSLPPDAVDAMFPRAPLGAA